MQEHFAPIVEGQGFAIQRLSGNVVAALATHSRRLLGASNPLASLDTLMRYGIMPTLDAHIAELLPACQGADIAGYIVWADGGLVCGGPDWYSLGDGGALARDGPVDVYRDPTSADGAPPAMERISNRFQWWLGSVILTQIADRPINRLRQRYGLAPIHEALWLGAASHRNRWGRLLTGFATASTRLAQTCTDDGVLLLGCTLHLGSARRPQHISG